MQNWIKTLVVGSCLLTMLLHMIPNGKFVKYVRFYAGLIFVLLAMQPVIQLLSGDTLEKLLRFALLREDSAELAIAVESMRELKDSQIMAACQKELVSQLEDLSCACGADTAHVTVRFSDSSEGIADAVSVSISILGGTTGQYRDTAAAIREKAEILYGIAPKAIHISDEGGAWL